MVVKGKALLELGGLFRSLWLVKRESRQKTEDGWRKEKDGQAVNIEYRITNKEHRSKSRRRKTEDEGRRARGDRRL